MPSGIFILLLLICLLTGAARAAQPTTRPATPIGQRIERTGDEIVVAGQMFHTTAPVVLWIDPGGYDAYRVERRFAKYEESSWSATTQAAKIETPNRYSLRESVLTPAEIERVRGGGWDLPLLQEKVDQFVIHYDVSGTSRQCFETLHDRRGLSVHFMLDLDGTIYQTLDAKERARHSTISNSRSVGIEIANLGSYTANEIDPFRQWYARDPDGRMRITIPPRMGDGGIRTPNFTGRPDRHRLIWGTVQGQRRRQYDFTPQQYESLTKLTAALCIIFPKMTCDYPKDAEGKLIPHKLTEEQWAAFSGILGHYHVQGNKADPGPAFQWDRVIDGARKLMRESGVDPDKKAPATKPAR